MKKILLGLGTVATVVAPIAATVSCGDDKDNSSLEETRTSCINKIKSDNDLSQEQKESFIQRIKDSKTKEEILEIAKEADQVALKAYKALQIAYVNSLDEASDGLTTDDKTTAVSEINKAESKAKVDEIVDALPSMVLERYKTTEALSIKNDKRIKADEQESWTNKLNAANDLDAAREVINQMNISIFDELKATAKAKLDSYKSLSKDNKTLCLGEINKAMNYDQLVLAIKHMDTLAFDEVKANAKTDADKKQGWTPNEKAGLKSKIDGAKDVDGLNAIIEAAELQHEKDNAKKEINLMDLLDSEKTNFAKDVQDADDVDKINEVLEKALLQEAKEKALKEIKTYKLSPSDETSFENEIGHATDLNGVQSAVDAALLQRNKNEASTNIGGYELSAEQKTFFRDMVNKANDQTSLKAAVDAALAQQQKNIDLRLAKTNEIAKIETYTLSDADKKALKNDVRNANDLETIKDIDKDALARQGKEVELNVVKDDAIITIDGLKDLTEEERTKFKDQIRKVTDKSQIPPIVAAAWLQQDKNEASKNIPGYKLSPDKETKFLSDIAKASTREEVKNIVDEALAEQTKEAALKKAKDDAIANINTYGLSSTDKDAFNEKINKAKDLAGVQAILDSAELQNTKEQGIKTLDGLKNISTADLNNYKTKVNSATSIESVELILKEAEFINKNLGPNNFDVTLSSTGNPKVSDVTLDLKHVSGLSDDEKLKVVQGILGSSTVNVEQEYDSRYGEEIPTHLLKVHGRVIPGIIHDLNHLTDDEKVIYVNNVFVAMRVNADDTLPDLEPETFWAKFSDTQANICPELNIGGIWAAKNSGHFSECRYGTVADQNLMTMATYNAAPHARFATKAGVPMNELSNTFKIQFFNNIFYPTWTGYQAKDTAGSLSLAIKTETKFVDGPNQTGAPLPNELVVNGKHFKVWRTSDKLNEAEAAKVYDGLVSSLTSLALIKNEEIKKVSSYNLTDAEKLQLIKDIQGAKTIKQMNDYINAAKTK